MSVAAKFKFTTRQHHVESTQRVLRALLRECTYLPDSASQVYIRKYVLHRFRNASERGSILLREAVSTSDEARQHEAKVELEQSLRKGYKGLYQLIRANEGEIKPLIRVLRHTYGRNGPRRYELMRKLLARDVELSTTNVPNPTPSKEDQRWTIPSIPVLVAPTSVKGDVAVYTISPRYSRLEAIVATQSQKNIETNRTRLSKRISIPSTNTWIRPMPVKRVRNLVKQKYAKLLDAILPPLPENEWFQLQGLALGTTKFEGCKPRRTRPTGCPPSLTASDLEKLVHLSDKFGERLHLDQILEFSDEIPKADKIIAAADDELIRGYWRSEDAWLGDEKAVDDAFDVVLEDELGMQTLNKNVKGKDRGHRITPRFMRHLWMEVFKECPMLQADGVGKKWRVTWGGAARTSLETTRSAKMDELFGISKRE